MHTLSSTTDILGDSKGIEVLSNAQVLAIEISKKQVIADKTEKDIDENRFLYKPVALKTSGLFFCISELCNIDPMYQYSLGFFINLFIQAIANSEPSEDIDERLASLDTEFLISLYRNICRSLFEKDKLIFSFLLNIKLTELRGDLNQDEWIFFLTGGVSLGGALPDPPAAWLSEKSWGELLRLDALPTFNGLRDDFEQHLDTFTALYDSTEPHKYELPEPLRSKFPGFQKLLILRVLRPDKVIPAVMDFTK